MRNCVTAPKDALLIKAIATEEKLDVAHPEKDLLEMEGMEKEMAYMLASHEITTMEELAEQSVDDLIEFEGIEEEQAARLIMTARAPWFAENK